MKNEEKNIARCIKSILPVIDELIVVDTGSTDNTMDIVKEFNARLYNFTWNDDFSAARNYAISKATGDWIIFLDADEFFSEINMKKLRDILKQIGNKGDAVIVRMCDVTDDFEEVNTSYLKLRIFRNSSDIRYVGEIHERLVKLGNSGLIRVDCSEFFTVFHLGYNKSVVQEKDKRNRNIDLLNKQLEKRSEDGNIYFYLSSEYLAMKDWEKTIEHGKLALKYGVNLQGGEAKTYANIIQAMLYSRQLKTEINSYITSALKKFPDYPDLYLLQSDYYRQYGLFLDEIKSLENSLKIFENSNIRSNYILSNYSSITLKNILKRLGYLYTLTGDIKYSVEYYSKLLHDNPYDNEVFQNLIKILLQNEKNEDIILFLAKNYKSEQDLVFVCKQSIILNAVDIFNYFYKLLPQYIQSLFKGYYHYFNNQYNDVLSIYLGSEDKPIDDERALMALVSAVCLDDSESVWKIIKNSSSLPIINMAEYLIGSRDELFSTTKIYFLKMIEDTLDLGEFTISSNLLSITEFFPETIAQEIGNIFFNRQAWQIALDYYNNALNKKQLNSQLYLNMECCWGNLNKKEKSLELMIEAVRLYPDCFEIYFRLINLCIELNKSDLLKSIQKQAMEVFPQSNWVKNIGF